MAAQLYAVVLVVVVALLSLGLGLVVFGTGELIVARDGVVILAKNDVLWEICICVRFCIHQHGNSCRTVMFLLLNG